MGITMIESMADIERMVAEWGFLPFFRGEIEGFSIEEHTPRELWFSDTQDGPWEWKGPIISAGSCAYGKFYDGKACFVRLDLLPHLINWRRSRPAGIAPLERQVLNLLDEHSSLRTDELRRLCGLVPPPRPHLSPIERAQMQAAGIKPKRANYKERMERALTSLQMQTRIITADFEYRYDRKGKRYGWGVARYCTPEAFYGDELAAAACSPEESRARLESALTHALPHATSEQIRHIVGT